MKDKKATINPINKTDNKFFHYAVAVALNHEQIEKRPERITKNKNYYLPLLYQSFIVLVHL